MNHNCSKIDCLTGDIIKYFANMRGAIKKEMIADPNKLVYEADLDTKKEDSTVLYITDGMLVEIDHASIDIETKKPYISKTLKVKDANYAVVIKYVKYSGKYINIKINIFAKDENVLEKMYGSVPRDLDFV